MKKNLLLMTAFTALFAARSYGQCPATPSVTIQSITDASCPSNGSVTLSGNGVGNSNILYKVIAAPNSSYVGTIQQGTNPVFANLEPGVYKIEMSCTAGSLLKDTTTFTIGNNYTAPSAVLASNSSCASGTKTITLSLSNIQGSSLPLQYAFYQTSDPNIADNLLSYDTATIRTFSNFGSYIVRIKDACGNYITKTINVAAPKTYYTTFSASSVNSCTEILSTLNLQDNTNTVISTIPDGGLTVNVYYEASPGSCTKGALYSSKSFAAGTATSGQTFATPRQQGFVIETVNSCGDAMTRCVAKTDVDAATTWNITNSSCSVPASTVDLTLQGNYRFYGTMNYCLYKNNVLRACSSNPNDFIFTYVPSAAGDQFYMIATDQCGISDTSNILTTPTAAPSVSVTGAASLSCTDGKMNVYVNVANIKKPDRAALVITSGPCCVGTTIATNLTVGTYVYDLLPGTYTVKITYPGGDCFDIPGFTFDVVPPNTTFTVSAPVSQMCGGSASITATINLAGASGFWGANTTTYDLVNSSNAVVASSANGVFNNVNPGTYTVKATTTFTGCTPNKVVVTTTTAIVTAAGAPPVVNKKYGAICEAANGTQLSNGSAMFDIAGFGPYDVYYSTTNNQPSTAQQTGKTSPITITGLSANQNYYFWFKDACGNTSSTQLGIVPIGKIWVEQATQPCVGSPFQLSMPDYPGATYTWKDTSGNTFTTGRIKDFGNYLASSDGEYIGTMTLANGCVVRKADVTLNSVLCAQPLPLKLLSFDGAKAGNYNDLSWSTADEKNIAHFEIERSADGANWNAIGIMSVDARQAITHDYAYEDQQPIDGTNYYRLKIVNNDQRFQFSQVVVIRKNGAVDAGAAIHIYPNPAHETATIELPSDALGTQIVICNSVGTQIAKQAVTAQQMTIATESLAPGVYYIVITKDNTTLYREKLTKL